MLNIIFLILIIFTIITQELKKNILNINIDIDKDYVSNMTRMLYKEFNEPFLKNKEFEDYNIIIKKKYLNEIDFSNLNDIPIISIIIPVYNGKKYISRSLLSIYAQSIKNIEIIYVDDYSTDNSIELISKFQKLDKRIKLFINKENRGTLYTKSYGVTKAEGKFVMIMDQDDIYINKNLFLELIEISEKNDLDILQFKYNDYNPELNIIQYDNIKFSSNYNKIIKQPELGDINLYLNENLYKSFFLWDKLIKRKIYLKALNFLGEKQWGINLVHREDHLMTFALYKMAKNYMKINKYGYSHILSEYQESKDYSNIFKGNYVPQNKREKMLLYQFQFSKFIFDFTKNKRNEKNVAIREIMKTVKYINFATKVYNENIKNLVINVSNLFLKCEFLQIKEKKYLLRFINIFYYLNYKIKYKNNLFRFIKLKII
jgi:glycosyltransferase involved in cell wall biosynthesis